LDLVDTLRSKIATFDDGDHISGLKATLGHIEVAFRHLARGQSDGDETAFTDAIYRTNQAFEGGIKEAYRVLTGKDPHKKTPYSIEAYLEKNEVFRGRVLNQFSNYRTEWRNPSTHDYKLYFDESEAFLAIISVSAFACLLSDQIAAKIAFDASKAATESQLQVSSEKAKSDTLYHQASALIQKFASTSTVKVVTGPMTEAVLLGSLRGAFASAMPNVEVVSEPLLSPEGGYRADLILKRGNDRLIVELKRYSQHRGLVAGREQVEKYLEVSGLNQALLVFMPDIPEEVEILEYNSDRFSAKIGILLPKSAIN
jgi:hypothetical protein